MDRFDKNNYEFNNSSNIGVFIIHGFSSTTYEVKELAEFLGKNGFHSIAKNLPGHGTSVNLCNKIQYSDWQYFIKEEIAKLASQSDKIYVIGCSMGAVLSLYAASIFPINGCVVGGTVLKFNNPFTINCIIPFLCKIIKKRKKRKTVSKKRRNKMRFYGYQEYPLIALNEFRKLNKIVQKNLYKIKCPSLIIHSNNDNLSLKKNVDIVFKAIQSKNKKIVEVKNSHHNLFDTNPDQKKIFDQILNFLNNN